LDEPTGDLDTKSTDIIMKILVDLNVKHFANRVVKMSDGKILKIQEIDMAVRNRYIAELDEKVAAHHSGALKNQVAIREGIYEASVRRDMERDGPPTIPPNFAPLKDVETSKTSVRRPSDYPILGGRFNKPAVK